MCIIDRFSFLVALKCYKWDLHIEKKKGDEKGEKGKKEAALVIWFVSVALRLIALISDLLLCF